jgi:hypothetical protein
MGKGSAYRILCKTIFTLKAFLAITLGCAAMGYQAFEVAELYRKSIF